MSNETTTSSFPASQQDVNNLKQTATDAATDLGNTLSTHASRAKRQASDLAGHVQEEGWQQINQAQGKLSDVANSAREYAGSRPLVCIGVAFLVGFFFGWTRRSS